MKLVSSIRYLGLYGHALRGRKRNNEKPTKPVRLRIEEDIELAAWLARTANYTSSDVVYKNVEIMGRDIV